MRPQTRIFSVATTIACLALTSPGFAQAYAGGGSAVQVDLGALNDLPGSGSGPSTEYQSPSSYQSPHYRSDRVATSGGDWPTTFVGGGSNTVEPVTPVQISRSSPYMPAHHVKPVKHRAAAKHRTQSQHHPVSHKHIPPITPQPIATTEDLNYMQLQSGKATLPGNTTPSFGPPPVRDVSMLPTPHPAEMALDASNGNDTAPSSSPASSTPIMPPPRSSGSARPAPAVITSSAPPPPYYPPTPPAPRVAMAAPANRDDYEEPRRQPSYKAEPPLPPVGPAPAATPDDLIDEPAAARKSNTRIISDPYATKSSSTPGFTTVGYYDIPSKISLSNPAPVRSAQIASASPMAAESISSGLPQAPELPPAPPQPKLLKVAPPTPIAPLTQAQSSNSQGIDAMPLDAPTPLVNEPAAAEPMKMTPPVSSAEPAIQKTRIASSAMARSSSNSGNDDLAATFAPGSVVLSADTNARLNGLVSRLKQNPDLRVELRSLASAGKETTSKARRTSLSRALAIKSYLSNQGISEDRIDVRALGAPPGQPASDRVDFFLMR